MQLATAEAIDQRVGTGITPNPPTTPALCLGGRREARRPIEWQPVIASPQSFSKHGRATDMQLLRPNWGSSVWRTDG